ncbi:hypothetical protein GN958_ATG06024 [Phytophthora infestans]|uniref:Uncharacterized protein n=1 Tax=Phytophthora infestans TaxID=4787 RepID=A0A8S9UV09_PHYIN|nr:hypothetical protein GN958_ATG06024 [Phytophthora infestans]
MALEHDARSSVTDSTGGYWSSDMSECEGVSVIKAGGSGEVSGSSADEVVVSKVNVTARDVR